MVAPRGFRAGPATRDLALWSQRKTAAPFEPIPSETAVKRVSVLGGFAASEMGFRVKFARQQFWEAMSALGQKQTSAHVRVMSALPPKADIECAEDQRNCVLWPLPYQLKDPI